MNIIFKNFEKQFLIENALGNSPTYLRNLRTPSIISTNILGEGDMVRVFSRSAEAWVEGKVVEIVEEHYVHVEFELAKGWQRKTLHVHSENLRVPSPGHDPSEDSEEECEPGTNFFSFEQL